MMPECSVPECQTAIIEADLNNSNGECVAVMRCHAAIDLGDDV